MGLRDAKLEERADIKSITKATTINIVYILLIFFGFFFVLGDLAYALVYTLMAQILALIANWVFWIRWSFKKLKVTINVKVGLSAVISVAMISGIWFIWLILYELSFVMIF